jgi:hypothetical protein
MVPRNELNRFEIAGLETSLDIGSDSESKSFSVSGRNFPKSRVFLSNINPENSRESDFPPVCNSPLHIGGFFFVPNARSLHFRGRILTTRVNVIVNYPLQ